MTVAILLLSAALAQEGVANYDTSGDWRDCQNHSPIAGTAGYANARSALATNALAYGATAFLQSDVLPMLAEATEQAEDGKWHGAGAYVYRLTAGAAQVPTKELGYPFAGCPSDLRISNRPLDLGAVQLGGAASNGTYGVFYGASITYGVTPANDPRERFLFHMSGFTYGSIGAAFAPLAGKDQTFGQGASAVQADFVLGGLYDKAGLHARAGWVGSRGLYADVSGDLPLFFSGVVDNASLSNLLSAGLRRLDTPLGHSSVFARNQPFRPLPGLDADGAPNVAPTTTGVDFSTGHLAQQDIAGRFDLAFAYALAPTTMLHQAQVGFHSAGFWDPTDTQAGTSFLLQAGMVALPDLWFYGVEGGARPSLRVEVGLDYSDATRMQMHLFVLYNDPDQLVLFPYAYDALSLGLRVDFGA